MDELLPSYESAIDQNPWVLIARYLSSESLCSAALVNRKWHTIMTPELWGKPASHFGVQNDTVYVALTRFKRTLPYARPFVRALTHTLEFPPAHAELYGGPHAEWLRNCLEYLPRLQCLRVNGLPFFDHAALLNLRYSSRWLKRDELNSFPSYGLRLLDASGCTNATSTGLAEALLHFPDLVSLDLSRTMAAKDDAVLKTLHHLRRLRILNLQGLALKDADFATVAQCIQIRVRSLDICDNNLTDASARLLLEFCLKESPSQVNPGFGPQAPVEGARPEAEAIFTEQGSLATHLRHKLTSGFAGRLAVEEGPNTGITHLYLSNNLVTVEGISGLLRSQRLQVLDIGILPRTYERPSSHSAARSQGELALPSVSKLTPVLKDYAAHRLQYLRINYELVTEDSPAEIPGSPRAELPGSLDVYHVPDSHELEALETPAPELDAVLTNVAELPGDQAFVAELTTDHMNDSVSNPATQKRDDSAPVVDTASKSVPAIELTEEPQYINKGAAFAPEPVRPNALPTPIEVQSRFQHTDISHLHVSSVHTTSMTLRTELENSSRHNSMSFVEDRRAKLDLRQSQENRLHPGMLPKVHTLVLTDVPSMACEKRVVQRIIKYIEDAAEEAAMARERARHTYILPPGRARAIAEKEYARSLFSLRRIVLEMASPPKIPRKIANGWRAYPTKSSTEDADSEAFWEAATYDFSFFDDEECGLPVDKPNRSLPLSIMGGLEVVPSQDHNQDDAQDQAVSNSYYHIDVIAELGQFRRDRKAAFENLINMGELEPEVQGYWPGDITILRKSMNTDEGELDCYGNRYQAGWYYR